MHTVFRRSISFRLFAASGLAAMVLAPTASRAQNGNTATGIGSLDSITSGSYNSANGFFALNRNATGSYNTANGYFALLANTTGTANSANGAYALFSNTTGYWNSANGYSALASNKTGIDNTANGFQAMYLNVLGGGNTANGKWALYTNTGSFNTANGLQALYLNTSADYNTATGGHSMYSTTTGYSNTANGYGSLFANTTGSGNVAEGANSLFDNSVGINNVAVGISAGLTITGSGNIALGPSAGDQITTGSNNIAIGSTGTSADTGIIRIGTAGTHKVTYIAGISGVGVRAGVPVYVNTGGQLGTILSSERFKFDIHSIGAKSDRLMNLRPVTFRYKEADPDGSHSLQYGLIAEEVAKVYPDLVQYDKDGKPFTVYYHLLTPMMLDQLQKAHHQLDAQQAEITALKSAMQSQGSTTGSLQHSVQVMGLCVGGFALAGLSAAVLFLCGKPRQLSVRRARPIETCSSL